MEFNPYLKPWDRPTPNEVAGKGYIEEPSAVENIVWQTRAAPPGEYENRLGDALEEVFGQGIVELDALVDKLNELGIRTPDGQPWTPSRFEAEMERLGY